MLDLLNKLKPRVQVVKQLSGGLTSVRWLVVNFDYVKGQGGFKFIQFGKGSIKWMMYLPRGVSSPLFLNGIGWDIKFNKGSILMGTTRKPLNFKNMWRVEDAKHSEQNRGRGKLQQGSKPIRLGIRLGDGNVGVNATTRSPKRDVPIHDYSVSEVWGRESSR